MVKRKKKIRPAFSLFFFFFFSLLSGRCFASFFALSFLFSFSVLFITLCKIKEHKRVK